MEEAGGQPSLRRVVSLPWLVLYGLGTTIGAGIYALSGLVAGRAGMAAPVSFLLAAAIALFSALSFAELSSRFPRAGGEVVYVREGFGSLRLSALVGVLVAAAGLISAATVSVAFAGHLAEFVEVPLVLAAGGVVLVLGAVAAWGVRESVTAAGLVTLVEVGGLLAVIAYGAPHLAELPERLPEMLPRGALDARAVASAAVLAFYAFLGFEDMVNMAEEVRDVRRTMPLGIVVTLVLTAILYVVTTSIVVLAVPPSEIGASSAPLLLVFERAGGPVAALGVVALLALLNGALVQVVKAARVMLGLALQGSLPAAFARIHPRTRTPLLATAIAGLVAGGLAIALPLEALAEATSLVTLLTFALANLALVLVKRRGPPSSDTVSFPLAVPVVGFALTCTLVAFDVAQRLGR